MTFDNEKYVSDDLWNHVCFKHVDETMPSTFHVNRLGHECCSLDKQRSWNSKCNITVTEVNGVKIY